MEPTPTIYTRDGRSSTLTIDRNGTTIACSCGWSLDATHLPSIEDANTAYEAHTCHAS